ncbi:MAG: hypothetical protein ACT4QF_18870 [Sporichthyaceae bacterium]
MTRNSARGGLRRPAAAVVAGGGLVLAVTGLTAGSASADSYRFQIQGSLSQPLGIGSTLPLNLRIVNPNEDPLRLVDLTVEIDSISAAGCGRENFEIVQADFDFGDSLIVAGEGSRTLSELGLTTARLPQVRLLNTAANQDPCLGADVDLVYTGAGRIFDRDVPGRGNDDDRDDDRDRDRDNDRDDRDRDNDRDDRDRDDDHDDDDGGFLPHTGGWGMEVPAAAAGLLLLGTGAAVVVRSRRRQGGKR